MVVYICTFYLEYLGVFQFQLLACDYTRILTCMVFTEYRSILSCKILVAMLIQRSIFLWLCYLNVKMFQSNVKICSLMTVVADHGLACIFIRRSVNLFMRTIVLFGRSKVQVRKDHMLLLNDDEDGFEEKLLSSSFCCFC